MMSSEGSATLWPWLAEQDKLLVEEMSQKLRRDVNCLSEKDRSAKCRAMERLRKETVDRLKKNEVPTAVVCTLCESLLLKPVLRLMSDNVERCRCLAVEFVLKLLPAMSFRSLKQCLPYILPTLVSRLGVKEIAESSEELRLELVEYLHDLIKSANETSQAAQSSIGDATGLGQAHLLAAYIDDLSTILTCTLMDPFHDVKKVSCKCIHLLAVSLPRHFQLQAESFVAPLASCLTHQHSKVRIEGLRALCSTILHGPVKCIENSLSPLALRAFDQAPTVRVVLLESVAKLLREYVDRYSFHHRLLPLLVCGLTDEVEEIQLKTKELFLQVGSQYLEENEQEMKDETDFGAREEHENELQRSVGCCTLIQRNLFKIVPPLLRDMQEWTQSTRVKSISVLRMTLSLAGKHSTQQLPAILAGLYVAGADENDLVREKAFECAEELGKFIAIDTLCDLILSAVCTACGGRSKLSATVVVSPASAVSSLTMLARCLRAYNTQGRCRDTVQGQLQKAINILSQDAVCHASEERHQLCLLAVIEQIMAMIAVDTLARLSLDLFTLLVKVLTLSASPTVQQQVNELISRQAVLRGMASSSDLFSDHLQCVLDRLQDFDSVTSSSVISMASLSPLLQGAGSAVGLHLRSILYLLERAVGADVAPDTKLDYFEMLAGLLERAELTFDAHQSMGEHVVHMIKTLYLPNLIWKPGRSLVALRAAVMGSLLVLLHCQCVVNQHVIMVLDDLLPAVFSGMDDDLLAGRLLSIRVLQRLLTLARGDLQSDCLHRIYPELLKRLDDSDDQIRLYCAETWLVFFGCFPMKYDSVFYGAHTDTMYKGLLVHMDDQSTVIQTAIMDALKVGGRLDAPKLLRMMADVKSRHRSTLYCDQLAAHLA